MSASRMSALCQRRTSGYLFDYLVGTGAHGRRHGEAQRLSGIEIDRKVVLGWGLHWQISRLLTFEDAIDVASRAPNWSRKFGPYEINPPPTT